MNIQLPDALMAFVDEQATQHGYGSGGEYVCELIRKDQERLRLRTLLLAGAASPDGEPADPTYFEGLRERVRQGAQTLP